ncbi:MAG TPA: GNAT family N-acetyltransferase [Caulobacteraceae bacterium]
MTWPTAVELVGRHVKLTPLRPDHATALAEAVRAGELWKLRFPFVAAPEEMAADIQPRIALPMSTQFAVIEVASGEAVGLTAYLNADSQNRRLEIGSTWYGRPAQRTAINRECKRLLLGPDRVPRRGVTRIVEVTTISGWPGSVRRPCLAG